MDKHFIYHRLMDSMDYDMCPICTLINKNIDRFIDSLLYENVNDYKIREDIKKSKGYCNFHAWRLQKAGDPLAHAIIYGEHIDSEIILIDRYIKSIDTIAFKAKKIITGKKDKIHVRKLKEGFFSKDKCPFCKIADECEKTYISAFYEYMEHDNEFFDKFKQYGFLCNVHLVRLLDLPNSEGFIKEILEIQLYNLKRLSKNLDEIKRKSDYRFSHESKPEDEKIAWITAVRHWVGEQGMCLKQTEDENRKG